MKHKSQAIFFSLSEFLEEFEKPAQAFPDRILSGYFFGGLAKSLPIPRRRSLRFNFGFIGPIQDLIFL